MVEQMIKEGGVRAKLIIVVLMLNCNNLLGNRDLALTKTLL